VSPNNCYGRLRLKCDGTRVETRFRLSVKRTSPFKLAGASVQSTADSQGVRIGGSNAGYTMSRGSVKSTGYPLHSPVSAFTSSPVHHRVPSHFNWTVLMVLLHLVCVMTAWTAGKILLLEGGNCKDVRNTGSIANSRHSSITLNHDLY
jgi:hypothetical protein